MTAKQSLKRDQTNANKRLTKNKRKRKYLAAANMGVEIIETAAAISNDERN